jgi:ABC-2 type transport system ATP-binding protein
MLQVEQLSKRYGDRLAVNAVSFAIAAGETVGLLGPNGAGKTTVIAMISGIARPDSGQVSLGGVRVTQDANVLKRRVGLVPQDLALYDELSAWANLPAHELQVDTLRQPREQRRPVARQSIRDIR